MKRAIDIIKSEHRALAAVLSALSEFTDGIANGRFQPDFDLLEAMISYVTELPDKVHHPKEDDYLFVALRRRVADIGPVLDLLQLEHRDGPDKTQALLQALRRYRVAAAPEFESFREAEKRYVEEQWHHMSTEETKVLPLAAKVLTPEDWAAIDAQFAKNDNPWDGPAGAYKALFTRIVTRAPAPSGVGDAGDGGIGRRPPGR
jgi:branched-chain amino acid transport system ATP-binding protein